MYIDFINRNAKVISAVQAILAPGLLVVGALTKNKPLIIIGAVWCATVTLDTGRLTGMIVDLQEENSDLQDTIDDLKNDSYGDES